MISIKHFLSYLCFFTILITCFTIWDKVAGEDASCSFIFLPSFAATSFLGNVGSDSTRLGF